MLDLDAIEARAEAATLTDMDRAVVCLALEVAGSIWDDIADKWEKARATATDVPHLLAELRAAREVVEAAQANADTWDEHYHQRPVDRNLVSALTAYRAVVGEAR